MLCAGGTRRRNTSPGLQGRTSHENALALVLQLFPVIGSETGEVRGISGAADVVSQVLQPPCRGPGVEVGVASQNTANCNFVMDVA